MLCEEKQTEDSMLVTVGERAEVNGEACCCPVGSEGSCAAAWSVHRCGFSPQAGPTLALGNDGSLRCRMVHFLNWSSSKDHHGP